jgi:hypothetical protein
MAIRKPDDVGSLVAHQSWSLLIEARWLVLPALGAPNGPASVDDVQVAVSSIDHQLVRVAREMIKGGDLEGFGELTRRVRSNVRSRGL